MAERCGRAWRAAASTRQPAALLALQRAFAPAAVDDAGNGISTADADGGAHNRGAPAARASTAGSGLPVEYVVHALTHASNILASSIL